MKRIIIESYAIRNPYVGLGEFCMKLGRHIAAHAEELRTQHQIELYFIVPPKYKGCFGNQVHYLAVPKALRYILMAYPFRVDLFHMPHQYCHLKKICRAENVLMTIHDINFMYEKQGEKLDRSIRRFKNKLHLVSHLNYISQFAKTDTNAHFPAHFPNRVIYNGVTDLNSKAQASEAFASRLPEHFLFHISSLLPKKNIHLLVEMMKHLPEENLVIAGNWKSSYGQKLLGGKKTESYWLVHRNFFKTEIINGQMRVDLESFEKWYANQVKHKKVNGEDPGAELTKKSYSFRDAANLLGIHSSNLYEIWREEKLETFTVDFTKRIPIEVFEKWYENQIMYQKVGKMPTITDLQADFIPLHEAAALLGITKEKMSVITRASRFKDCFEIQVFEDKKWISKKSFQHFLNAQSVYQVVKMPGPVKQNNQESMETKEYISRSDAAALAGVTSGTITKWMQMERFSCVGAGKVLRINRKEFLQWLKEYQEGAG